MSVWSFDYYPHARFIAPARGTAQIWRLCLGLVMAAALFLALSQLVFGTLFQVMEPETVEVILADGQTGQTAGGMLIVLFQLGLLAVAAALVVIMVHKRGPVSLIGEPGVAVRQFGVVLLAMLILMAVVWVLPPYGYDAPLQRNMDLGRWLLLLPVALCAVLVQSGAEEVFFRGYIQQQLAARFKSPLVWMADLTARSGTLGPAIAVHFVNNLSAMVLTSVPDDMSGLALYVLPFGLSDEAQMAAWLPVDFGFMLVSWLVARLAIRA
jgi:membrane protease YdiL (CAAX protease family)